MQPLSWIEIDAGRLAANVATWRRVLESPGPGPRPAGEAGPRPRIAAVVKADGYGLGASRTAPLLEEAGVERFAVYRLEEALELIACGITRPLLVLAPVTDLEAAMELESALRRDQVAFSLDHPDQVPCFEALAARVGRPVPLHLHVDTGMNRGGLGKEEQEAAMRALAEAQGVAVTGLYTHFASADEDPASLARQESHLEAILAALGPRLPAGLLVHADNTHAALRRDRDHRAMVRIGLGLLGYGLETVAETERASPAGDLRPVVRWRARIIHVRSGAAGARVGYGGTRRLARRSRLGLVPVGYADGYPLALGNRAVLTLDAHPGAPPVPVLGRVNMDQVVIDLTDAPAARTGDSLTLLSDDPDSPCALARLAALADSNVYELLCRLSPRLPRIVTGTQETKPAAAR